MADDPQSTFLQTYGGLAQDVAGQTGLDPSLVLGQIAQETGWGQHVSGNNIYGISSGGSLASYPTVQGATQAYISLINSKYPAVSRTTDPASQAQALVAGGYNTADPNYAKSVAANAASIRARGPDATLSESDIDKDLLSPPPSTPVKPSSKVLPTNDELDRDLLSQNPNSIPTETIRPGTIDPLTHQPVQFAGPAPEGPVTRFMEQGAPVSGSSSPVGAALGSLPTDPAQRARILAAHFYPNLPLNQALSHLTPGPNGGMIVLGDDGKPIYEDPLAPSLSSPASLRPGNLLSYAASAAGPALPFVGGSAGGLIASPTSMVAGPALAAAGGAAGDLARQAAARYFDPTRGATPIDLGQTAIQAAQSGVGQLAGAATGNLLSPNTLRMTPGDIVALRSGSTMKNAYGAYDRAAAQGVQLTPGQATGLPSLLQYEDAAKTLPGTSDAAEAFYRGQGLQVKQAGQNMLNAVSPLTDKNAAASAFQQASEDAIRNARTSANATARPSYEAAQQTGQIVSPDLAILADQPAVSQALKAARVTYQNLYRTPAPDTPDFALWDLAKRQLDDAHTTAKMAGQRTDAMAIDSLRSDLIDRLDEAYPSYEQARKLAAPGQQLASQLEESGVGNVAGKTGDERAKAILAPIFEQNNPTAISRARDAFINAGRGDEWYGGVRAYIQDAFDKASMSQQGLNPAMLRRQVWGNTDNREAIQAALTPAQYQGFDRFMQTVEDTARTYPINSLTATRQAAQNSLKSAAESQGNVRLIDAIGSVFSPSAYANIGRNLLSGARQRTVETNVGSIVSTLFDSNGLRHLEEMANYSPTSLKAGNLAAQILARAAPPIAHQSANDDTNPLQAQKAAP